MELEKEKKGHTFYFNLFITICWAWKKNGTFPFHPSEIQIIYIALESRVDIDCLHDRGRGRRRLRRRRRDKKGNGNENGANNKQEKRKGHKISFIKWIYWNWNFVWSNVLERDIHDPVTLLHFPNKHVFSVLEYQDSGFRHDII